MSKVSTLYLGAEMATLDNIDITLNNLVVNLCELELMQFTGVLGKDGRDIYESDMVVFYIKDFNENAGYFEHCLTGLVKFNNGSFCIEYSNDYKQIMSLPFDSDILISVESFGNKYQGIW